MHDSRGVSVYLSCLSRPILENSANIGFAMYPSVVARSGGIALGEEEWFKKELIEDFNWLRKEHSPNWRIVHDTIGEGVWNQVLVETERDTHSFEKILHLVMP
jgi:tubulin-specific chaperone C